MRYRRSHYRRAHIRNTKYGKVYVSGTHVRATGSGNSFSSNTITQQKEDIKYTSNKMKKRFLILLLAIVFVLICINNLSKHIRQRNLEKAKEQAIEETNLLSEYWKEQFMSRDYETFIGYLQEECGLPDLQVEVKLEYDPQENYFFEGNGDERKTLYMIGTLVYTSDEIDNYYTEEYEGEKANILLRILKNLKTASYAETKKYEYANPVGDVLCYITDEYNYSYEIHVRSSSGHDYEYDYHVGWDTIEIDGNAVYRNNPGIQSGTVGISGNPVKALTKEEAEALKGTGYHNTRPGSMAESIELGAAQVKCKICGMHSDNGKGSKCDYCIRKYGY